jgi:hypothetical protein
MSDEKKFFSTRDIYLAATLVTMKFYMEGVDFQIEGEHSRPVGYFNFEDTPELREAEKRYIQGLVEVEPRQLFTSFKSLKAAVTNVYKNPHSRYNR